jgi:hypothetical protein
LPDTEWLPLSEGLGFPGYEGIVSPARSALARSILETQRALLETQLKYQYFPSSSAGRVDAVDPVDTILSQARGLSEANRAAFRKEARSVGTAIALSREGIAGLSRLSGVTFCPSAEFVGYFRSKSGHPTLVGFAPVTSSDGSDTFIVDAIVRRIPTDARAMDPLFAEMQREHPSVAHDRDMTTKCEAKLGCDPVVLNGLGYAEHPTNWTALQKARFQDRDYFIRFEPRSDEVQISFRLFDANDEELKRQFERYRYRFDPIASRLERARPAVCDHAPPPADVPSIE